MTITIIILALVVASVMFLIMRSRGPVEAQARPSVKRTQTDLESTGEFHAVSIKYLSSACDAAREMDGKRYLSSAAPRLPLPDCDSLQCKCKFVHHKDRRDGEDRRNPYYGALTSNSTGSREAEQRGTGDRRANPPDML